jgi:hypothetical protein
MIRNTSDQTLSRVTVTIDLFDARGIQVGTVEATADNLRPGNTGPIMTPPVIFENLGATRFEIVELRVR